MNCSEIQPAWYSQWPPPLDYSSGSFCKKKITVRILLTLILVSFHSLKKSHLARYLPGFSGLPKSFRSASECYISQPKIFSECYTSQPKIFWSAFCYNLASFRLIFVLIVFTHSSSCWVTLWTVSSRTLECLDRTSVTIPDNTFCQGWVALPIRKYI